MWGDIVLSISISISEAFCINLYEKRKRKKFNESIEKTVNELFIIFSDTSLDCNEFHSFVINRKFMEMIRNFFFSIQDNMDNRKYIENMEKYIYNQCPSVKHYEVREFINKINELYISFLHSIIEENPEINAIYQLLTVSNRANLARISENEEILFKCLNSLVKNETKIEHLDISSYHKVSEKEYGTIKFTGISGAENKKTQDISSFYVQNTFSFYGKEYVEFSQCGLNELSTLQISDFFEFGNKVVVIGGAGLGNQQL